MVPQSTLTIMAPIKPGAIEPLKAVLQTMSADVAGNCIIPFAKLDTTHFARLLVLDETTDLQKQVLPAVLVFMSDFDGSPDRYLDDLLKLAADGLDRVFGYCAGSPAPPATNATRRAYLRTNMTPAAAVYVNTIGRGAQQIRQEAQLREAIEDFLDHTPPATDDP